MNNIWQKDYEKVLKDLPKDAWVGWCAEIDPQYKEYEISVVHTSNPHGLISWGWDGNDKLIVIVCREEEVEDLSKKERKELFEKRMEIAKAIADKLNSMKVKAL